MHITMTVAVAESESWLFFHSTAGIAALSGPSERLICAVCTALCLYMIIRATNNDTFTIHGTECCRWRTVINIHKFKAGEGCGGRMRKQVSIRVQEEQTPTE